jgi:hypothetical protein
LRRRWADRESSRQPHRKVEEMKLGESAANQERVRKSKRPCRMRGNEEDRASRRLLQIKPPTLRISLYR